MNIENILAGRNCTIHLKKIQPESVLKYFFLPQAGNREYLDFYVVLLVLFSFFSLMGRGGEKVGGDAGEAGQDC